MFAVAEAQRKTQAKTDDVAKDDEKGVYKNTNTD